MKNARSFSPCCNIQTRQSEWALYNHQVFREVYDSVQIAAHFRDKYASDVKPLVFPSLY